MSKTFPSTYSKRRKVAWCARIMFYSSSEIRTSPVPLYYSVTYSYFSLHCLQFRPKFRIVSTNSIKLLIKKICRHHFFRIDFFYWKHLTQCHGEGSFYVIIALQSWLPRMIRSSRHSTIRSGGIVNSCLPGAKLKQKKIHEQKDCWLILKYV